jgi:hypothetical protein
MQEYRHEGEHKDQDELADVCDGWHDFPDPWDGDHNIEYWIWNGVRLVPTTPEERAHIQEDERTQAARRRLAYLQEQEYRKAHSLRRRLSSASTWCRGRVYVMVQWLRSVWRFGQAPRTEGARAERSPTKR